jgi:hypothetical protein
VTTNIPLRMSATQTIRHQPNTALWTACYSRRTQGSGPCKTKLPEIIILIITTSPLQRRGTSCVSPLHKTVTMIARSGVVVDTATSFKRPSSVQTPERAVQSENTFTFYQMPGHRSRANNRQTYLGLCHTATLLTPLRIEMAKNRCPSDSIDRQQHCSL